MPVLKNEKGTDVMVSCICGCDEGIRFQIDKDDSEMYCFMTYTNGAFYRNQGDTIWNVIKKKVKKIWSIIRNKDYIYGELYLSEEDFKEFRENLNKL